MYETELNLESDGSFVNMTQPEQLRLLASLEMNRSCITRIPAEEQQWKRRSQAVQLTIMITHRNRRTWETPHPHWKRKPQLGKNEKLSISENKSPRMWSWDWSLIAHHLSRGPEKVPIITERGDEAIKAHYSNRGAEKLPTTENRALRMWKRDEAFRGHYSNRPAQKLPITDKERAQNSVFLSDVPSLQTFRGARKPSQLTGEIIIQGVEETTDALL